MDVEGLVVGFIPVSSSSKLQMSLTQQYLIWKDCFCRNARAFGGSASQPMVMGSGEASWALKQAVSKRSHSTLLCPQKHTVADSMTA